MSSGLQETIGAGGTHRGAYRRVASAREATTRDPLVEVSTVREALEAGLGR